MPESAEVKITTEQLDKSLDNKVIVDWVFPSGQYFNREPDGFEEFYDSLPLLVQEVGCKGKTIYIICHNEFKRFYILHSMRMTGSWKNKPVEYCSWYVEIEKGKKLYFRNPRRLATLSFISNEDVFDRVLNSLGPDILTDGFTLEVWDKLLKKHSQKNITSFMMDQSIISGCGNYIKAEALYYAKISPLRKVHTLNENERDRLFQGLRIVPRSAYNFKGVSIRDFTDENSIKGGYEYHLKIYGKKWATRSKTPDGRITYWDPEVQK